MKQHTLNKWLDKRKYLFSAEKVVGSAIKVIRKRALHKSQVQLYPLKYGIHPYLL